MITGGCTCGAIRYEYSEGPILSYKCHCNDCQQYSSAGYVALLWAWNKSFNFTDGSPTWRICIGSSGKEVSRGFCSVCGTPVAVRLGVLPMIMGLPASSLDDISIFEPEYETWVSSAPSWDLVNPKILQLEGNFTLEILQHRLFGAQDP